MRLINIMNNKYILSISIPAFGYPKSLKRNINNLLQIDREDIEFVIVDNDHTGTQIGDFVDSITDCRLHYYRNETNIGRSANIAKAVEMSKADHVLIASCDDLIRLSSIDRIIDSIKKHPRCGVIMGKIHTDLNSFTGYLGEEHLFKKGYEALSVVSQMGFLFPFVLNRKYIDYERIYMQEENYMQTRLLYLAAGRGDFIGIPDVIADVIDQRSYRGDCTLECYEFGWDKIKDTWSFGECYYSPKARADQLKQDLDSIEAVPLRHSHLIKLIDHSVNLTIIETITYVFGCHDKYLVKNAGSVGFLDCDEVLEIFRREMDDYFKVKEEKGVYCYRGRLNDRIKNEKIVLKQIKRILRRIQEEDSVAVYGNSSEKEKLKGILKYMNIGVSDSVKGHLALASEIYDEEREKEIMEEGAKEVLFFDWMARYLTIAWLDDHCKEELWGDFCSFE